MQLKNLSYKLKIENKFMEVKRNLVNAVRERDTGLVVETTLELRLFDDQGHVRNRIFIDAYLEGDPNDPNFIPFEDLSNEIVMQWTLNELGESAIVEKEDELISLEQQKNSRDLSYPYIEELPEDRILLT